RAGYATGLVDRHRSARPAATWIGLRNSARSCLIADPPYSHDNLGTLRVSLDLRPEALHVHVDQPCVGGVPVAPDLLEEDLPGESLARLASQGDQQIEFQRGEADDLAVTPDRVTGHIDGDLADRQHLRGRIVGPPQPGADPSDQDLRLEGLDDVV